MPGANLHPSKLKTVHARKRMVCHHFTPCSFCKLVVAESVLRNEFRARFRSVPEILEGFPYHVLTGPDSAFPGTLTQLTSVMSSCKGMYVTG